MRATAPSQKFDVGKIRDSFPILHQKVRGKRLVYLDSAASAQVPTPVLETVRHYEESDRANVHRAAHTLGTRATQAFEGARETARAFLGAESADEIVFTKSCTESINLVANCLARCWLKRGDVILLTQMEHHSNIVPWQMAAEQSGARIEVAPVLEDGTLDLERFSALLGHRIKVVAATHVSNTLGTVNPVRHIVEKAHEAGAAVVLDGAQAAPHLQLDLSKLGVDFYALSGHKMYGPTGIGVLYGKKEWLRRLPPYQGGGDMIRSVTFEATTYAEPPTKFEAGTPNISGAIGLAAAMKFIQQIGHAPIADHERTVVRHAVETLSSTQGVRLIGTPSDRCAVVSFVVEGVHPHDVGTILDTEGIAVRAGHHCTQPLMERYGVPATVRASFGVYSTLEEVDRLAEGLAKAREMFL